MIVLAASGANGCPIAWSPTVRVRVYARDPRYLLGPVPKK